MLLSAVSVLVVAQSSSEIPEGLMNNPVHAHTHTHTHTHRVSHHTYFLLFNDKLEHVSDQTKPQFVIIA